MEKLEKFIPDKIQIVGHSVVISEKTFSAIVNTFDNMTNAINQLIDRVNTIQTHSDEVDTDIANTKDAIVKLAHALKTYTEE